MEGFTKIGRRWTLEYLPFLVRSKWFEENRSVQENDIVVVVDSNGPRNIWPKGRVVQVDPDKDGKIRVVDVRFSNGTILRRPVSRLCVLDVEKKEE
ncbi:hypothetical protein JTB14_000669 [Gonioctena quinquepunctata]|nr:hypothetical protein JTB14_000669 [Gonioctena quinquepunctata]